MKKSITERIDFSSGFFINFWWVFERFLDTFSDGKTVRKSLSREGRFHPFFHSFFEVSHSKSKPCDPRSIRKFSYNSWGPVSRRVVKICRTRVRTRGQNHRQTHGKIDQKFVENLSRFSTQFLSDFSGVRGRILASESTLKSWPKGYGKAARFLKPFFLQN